MGEQRRDRAHPRRLQRQADEHHLRGQPQGRPKKLRRDDLEVRGGHPAGRLERRDGHPLQVAPVLLEAARCLGRQLRALHPPPERDRLLDRCQPRPAPAPAERGAVRPHRPPARLQPRVLPLRRHPVVEVGGRDGQQGGRRARHQVGHPAQRLHGRHRQPRFQRGRIRPLHLPAFTVRKLSSGEPAVLHRGPAVFHAGRGGRA